MKQQIPLGKMLNIRLENHFHMIPTADGLVLMSATLWLFQAGKSQRRNSLVCLQLLHNKLTSFISFCCSSCFFCFFLNFRLPMTHWPVLWFPLWLTCMLVTSAPVGCTSAASPSPFPLLLLPLLLLLLLLADVDECAGSRRSCHPSQRCVNTAGSFFCELQAPCPAGYQLRSRVCEGPFIPPHLLH